MNLDTKYLGLNLSSPLVASASPISEDLDNIKLLEDHGASAVVLYSLFEEQIRREQHDIEHHSYLGTNSYSESLSYFPEPEDYRLGPDAYLDHIRKAKESVDIPIIGSLNGSTPGGWTKYARYFEEAGADAIELNIYHIPADPDLPGSAIEEKYLNIVWSVKEAVGIPVSVKLSPFFSNFSNMAHKLEETGADGLVLFNRFYQPDIDTNTLELVSNIKLSSPWSQRLPMRWIAILKDRIRCDLAATSGIHTGEDAVKMLLVGADVTMMCSALLRNGISHIKKVKSEIYDWLEENEYESVNQLRGSMCQARMKTPEASERGHYMKAITYYTFYNH